MGEVDANTSLSILWAWSRCVQRAYLSVPGNRGPDTTLFSTMTIEGMGLPVAVKGATTEGVFEAYVEIILSPMLCPGQAVVMDNLTAHREMIWRIADTHLLKRLS